MFDHNASCIVRAFWIKTVTSPVMHDCGRESVGLNIALERVQIKVSQATFVRVLMMRDRRDSVALMIC